MYLLASSAAVFQANAGRVDHGFRFVQKVIPYFHFAIRKLSVAPRRKGVPVASVFQALETDSITQSSSPVVVFVAAMPPKTRYSVTRQCALPG